MDPRTTTDDEKKTGVISRNSSYESLDELFSGDRTVDTGFMPSDDDDESQQYSSLQNLNSTEIKKLEDDSRAAVKMIGPRVYNLEGLTGDTISFYAMGCQGYFGKQPQKDVAALMNRLTAEATDKPAFVLILGDNIYDYGVSSPLDPGFNICFHNIYSDQLPYFLILGNHDENFHKKWAVRYNHTPGEETAINEVAHNYVPDGEKYKTVDELRTVFEQKSLDVNTLQQWNMPYFYYSIIAGDLQIFCLDSNSYAREFLDAEKMNVKINQTTWLKQEYDKAKQAGRKVMVTLHHPLYTSGKRAFPAEHDSTHYLLPEQIKALNAALKREQYTSSYNTLLADIFAAQQIEFDMVFAAHDHFVSYYNNKLSGSERKLCQVTSGGGGGELQERSSFSGHPYVASHFQNNGVAKISCAVKNPEEIKVELYTTANHHIVYTNKSHHAVREAHSDQQIEDIRALALRACDEYLHNLKEEENKKQASEPEQVNNSNVVTNFIASSFHLFTKYMRHDEYKAKEIKCIHNIIAWLNQPKLPELNLVLLKLLELTSKDNLPNRELDKSFFKSIWQKKFKADFGSTLEELHAVLTDKPIRSPSPVTFS